MEEAVLGMVTPLPAFPVIGERRCGRHSQAEDDGGENSFLIDVEPPARPVHRAALSGDDKGRP